VEREAAGDCEAVMRRPAADPSHWDAKAPVTTVMDVPGETWQAIADHYPPEDEAFAKLEHILRNRLKWIVGEPTRLPA
jgi:hypothetical protein